MFEVATKENLPKILEIYKNARTFMAECGNGGQWGDSYPEEELLLQDIAKKQLYVYKENGDIHGVFAFIIGEDKTYQNIEAGSWLSHSVYGTIHRIASDREEKGFLQKTVSFCESKIPHLRIDTHEKNHIMRHLIPKNGFSQCGIIHLEDGSPRIAFEKI